MNEEKLKSLSLADLKVAYDLSTERFIHATSPDESFRWDAAKSACFAEMQSRITKAFPKAQK